MRNDERTPTTPPGIDRRRFLKFTGAGFVAAASGGPLLSAFSQSQPQGSASATGTWMASTCQGCTSWCPVQVKVVDGRAVSVRGNPHSKANHGKICPRPHMALQQAYDPDRLKVPMKRTNPNKGRDEDPGFVPIGWDEAIGHDRRQDDRAARDGRHPPVRLFRGRYSYMRDIIYSAMPKVFGSPNGISHSAICAEGEKFGAYYTEGFWGYRDYDLNTPATSSAGGPTRSLPTARCRTPSTSGAKCATRPKSPSSIRASRPPPPRPTTGCRSSPAKTPPWPSPWPTPFSKPASGAVRIRGRLQRWQNHFIPGGNGR